jgi:hypothetical protein|uniref:Uncharacterized protein n=1 Tax=Phaeodactylum tricornutum TaxID=2850 RepID=A0A8J9SFN1_PHATR
MGLHLYPHSLVGIILMPVSQIFAWHTVLKRSPLFTQVFYISMFYFGWALWKRIFLHDSGEIGFIPFGLLALTSYLGKRNYSVIATLLLLINFGFAAKLAFGNNANQLAKMIKDDTSAIGIVWAYMFKAYIISSICLWGKVFHDFLQLPADGYDPLA